MSFIQSAMQTLFGGNPAPVANAPTNPMQTANPGSPLPGTVANNATAPNGVIPSATVPDPNAAPVSPLDAFKDLWNNPVTPPGEEPNKSMFGNMDPNKVLESARRVDFVKGMPAELLVRIEKGGPDAMVALSQAMNHTGQTVYGNSAIATTKIVEQALAKQQTDFLAQLPSLVRKFSANENLRTENPILNNPAVQPFVGALTEQLSRKSPNASAAEIQAQVMSYLGAFGETFAAKPKETAESKSANAATDWSRFLES